jgi:hypothetical protein
LPGKLARIVVPLLVAHATAARAADEEAAPEEAPPEAARRKAAAADDAPEAAASADAAPADTPSRYYPPPVDGPALRLPESPTRLYFDGSYAIADDLSALPYIAGKAENYRAALGAAWRWRRFTFDGQLPLHVTDIDVTSVLNMPPMAQDAEQTVVSLGDLTLGATWSERLTGGEGLIAGLALRGRLATHTTRFDFHLPDGTQAIFVIPYYFHIEPTLVLGGAIGRFTYVMNQGAIALVGPDGNLENEHISVPSLFFWDAHYALAVAPWRFLGASLELATTIQLNHIEPIAGLDVEKFNNIRAAWVAHGLQVYAGAYRIDVIARLGLSRGQQVYGVLEYVGTHSFMGRLTRHF